MIWDRVIEAVMLKMREGKMNEEAIQVVASRILQLDFMIDLEGKGKDSLELCYEYDTWEVVHEAADKFPKMGIYSAMQELREEYLKRLE